MLKKILYIIIPLALLVVTASIAYYFFILLPANKAVDTELAIQHACIDQVHGQEKEMRGRMTYDATVEDRGCSLEAGCMTGVIDPNHPAKFIACNKAYYYECLDRIKQKAEDEFALEQQNQIDTCIDQYVGK